MLRYRIIASRYNELIICTNYAFDSRFMVRDCELQQVIERPWIITISNRRQQLSVESVFADLSTTVQIRFFHWITMRHAEERHCERVRKSKPATKLMCTFSDLPVKLFRFCFTPFITLAFSLFLSPTPLAPFPFSFFLSLSFNIVVGKTKVKSI